MRKLCFQKEDQAVHAHSISHNMWSSQLKQMIHSPTGIEFHVYLDKILVNQNMESNYAGFLHHVPIHPPHPRYKPKRGLQFLLDSKRWKRNNRDGCKGLFTLCEYTASYLRERVPCKVSAIPHPIMNWHTKKFDFDAFKESKRVYFIGNMLREFDQFVSLKTTFRKSFIGMLDILEREGMADKGVEIVSFMPQKEYENVLATSIVFETYFDVACSGTILECMATNTPIVLNRLPAAEEYLGTNYPLFYNDIEEAEKKLADMSVIKEAHLYLKHMDKSKFTIKNMANSILDSEVYKDLPHYFSIL